jgi:hypothetical protein
LKLKELNITPVQTQLGAAKWTDTFFTIEDLTIGHFDTIANPVIPAGMTVRNIMQKKVKLNNVAQSHAHRGAVLWDTNERGETRFGIEVPCLAKNPTYMGSVNWQRGLALLRKNTNGKWQPEVVVF